MNTKKLLTFFAFFVFLLITTGICALGAEEELPTITVATCDDIEPFVYIKDGELCGIDIDIMNEICSIAQLSPEYHNLEFDAMIPCVRSPLADCAISAITATDYRKKVVDFTDTYIDCKIYNPNIDKWFEESYAIPVKLTGEYKEALNTAIKTLKENGKIHEIALKYGLEKDSDGFYVYKMPIKPQQNNSNDYLVSEWAKTSVANALNKHWSSANDFDNDFTADITREQFCEIAYNMIRDSLGVNSVNLAEVSFTDTENTKVLYLAQEGIVNGKGDGSFFAPNDTLTRAEAASILYRIAKYAGMEIAPYNGAAFEDDATIPEWAKETVYLVASAKIMSGTGNGFSPNGTYTAEQAISTIERLYNSIK